MEGPADMSTTDDLFAQYQGQVLPVSFNGGFVALSYVVSLIGAISTLELINRRTSPKGLLNHVLLVSAAVSMGGIAIWCMHFIGNRAIDLAGGEAELQIAYSPGFTALSFFMPILVLVTAFLAIGTNEAVSWVRVAVGGVLAGSAICGMHYLGNASIENYSCIYSIANVVGAAVIAWFASTVAFAIFFVFRASWNSSWLKRLLCAIVLAGAVSGMHWCASLGTQYRLLHVSDGSRQMSRNVTVIIVICLSVGACLLIGALSYYAARVTRSYADKAQQVVLAAAVFDSDGRLLVSPDGHLPSEIITDTFLEKSANDQFGTAHPLFQWMFQASRNWPIIQTLIAGMENHLAHLPRSSKDVKTGISLMTEHGAPIDNYDLIVRELFCVAAATLADKMKLSLSQVGVLWDEILPTGAGHVRNSRPGTIASAQCGSEVAAASPALPRSETTSSQAAQAGKNSNMTVTTAVQSPEDLAEKGLNNLVDNRRQSVCYQQHQQQQQQQQNHSVYRGSLMFLVRTADRAEVERLQAAGYRFAELHQVSGKIATTMQIKAPLSASTKPGAGSAFESKLRNMAAYAHGNGTDAMLEPGVHLGFFGVRARVGHYGFDVVVRRGMRNLLPSVRIPGLARLDAWHVEFLARLDRMTPTAVLRRLEAIVSTAEAAGGNGCSPKEAGFAAQLADAIDRLRRDWLSDNDPALFDESVLTARAVDVPCRPADGSGDGSLNMCSLIAFRVVIPIHASRPPPEGPCELVPLSFFKVHQLSCRDSPHHAIFARSVHRELAPLIYSVPWDPKLLGKHHHHYHHQYHHRLFQPYPPQSDKLLTTTTHSSSADDSATTASRRRASLSIRGSLVVQNKLRKSLGKAPADDCEGISHEGIGSGPEDDSDSHSTRSSSTLKLWPGRGSTAATDVDSAATSPAHYQEHHGHQHQETPALAAIGESSVPSSSPKPASNMAMTSGAAAAGSTSPPLPASRSPVPPQAAQLHQPSQSTALGGIMVSSEITVQVHDLPSRQNGGVRFLASSVSSPSGQELATAEGRRVSLSLGNNTGQASTPGSGSSLLARRTSIQTQQRRQSLQFSGEMQQQQLPEPPEQDKDNKSSTNNHRPATAKSTGTGAGAAGAPIELQPLTPRMASIIGAPMPAATAAAAATTTGASAAVEVERAAGARETFVDELFAICVEGR